jgi:hypothetical protein
MSILHEGWHLGTYTQTLPIKAQLSLMLSHGDVFGGGGGAELERKWPTSRPGPFVPEKITPVPIWEKSGWAQGMSELQKKNTALRGIKPGRPAHSLFTTLAKPSQLQLLLRTIIALMMEAARTCETSVDIQLRTRQYIPEDSELYNIYTQ